MDVMEEQRKEEWGRTEGGWMIVGGMEGWMEGWGQQMPLHHLMPPGMSMDEPAPPSQS